MDSGLNFSAKTETNFTPNCMWTPLIQVRSDKLRAKCQLNYFAFSLLMQVARARCGNYSKKKTDPVSSSSALRRRA
jgi:hypothetical protein